MSSIPIGLDIIHDFHGDTPAYFLRSDPSGVQINRDTGELVRTPTNGQADKTFTLHQVRRPLPYIALIPCRGTVSAPNA